MKAGAIRARHRRQSSPTPPGRRSLPKHARVAAPHPASGASALGRGQAHPELLGDARRDRARHRQATRRDRARAAVGSDIPHQPALDSRRHRAGAEPALAAAPGYELPSLFVVSTSRGKIATASRARRRRRRSARELPRHRHRFQGARDPDLARRSERRVGQRAAARHRRRELGRRCLDLLIAADSPNAGETSLVDRLKGLLGLKPRRGVAPARNRTVLPLARILPRPLRILCQTEAESGRTELSSPTGVRRRTRFAFASESTT